jgi:hypothetical protein
MLEHSECQKEDWPKHKLHCGEKKVSKKLPGTAQDPFWANPDTPDYIRRIPITETNKIDVHLIGFADPTVASKYSVALKRQLALLEADIEAEYFLFDVNDNPVRVVVIESFAKMGFRTLRAAVLALSDLGELEDIAEFLVKFMGQWPGLSRAGILKQLQREYGVHNLAEKIERHAKQAAARGHWKPGVTFLEAMSDNINKNIPLVRGKITVGVKQ